MAIFAIEYIPENTYFNIDNDSKKMNNLAYSENDEYTLDKIKEKTNVLLVVDLGLFSFSNGELDKICCKSIKDIKCGDELSRAYGLKYWNEYDF